VETRLRHRASHDKAGVRHSAHGSKSDGVALGLDGRDTVLP
jgi:hypothetical protein